MLKGITTKNIDYSTEFVPFTTFTSVTVNSLSLQDTSKIEKTKAEPSQNQIILPKTGIAAEKYADSIFARNALREKLIKAKELKLYSRPSITNIPVAVDTNSTNVANTSGIFRAKETSKDLSGNFLLNIAHKNISQQFDTSLLPKSNIQNQNIDSKAKSLTVHKTTGFEGNIRKDASLDWLPIVLLVSLFIFSWIKLLYQKYVVQVVASIVNYQVSVRLLRERNVLFRNMAIGLNLVFAINAGIFIFYIFQYNELKQFIDIKFLNVLIYSAGVIILYNAKTLICRMLGNIFMVKEQFSEYIHNIHLYNKNVGLFLFPVIILFPYIANDKIKPFVIYFGISIIVGMSLLLVYRGFQIIMRNGVSIFYLILYLCAVEILPVLLLIKYSYTLIYLV
jgi:hypothetical protein